jgi:hypothetical protein
MFLPMAIGAERNRIFNSVVTPVGELCTVMYFEIWSPVRTSDKGRGFSTCFTVSGGPMQDLGYNVRVPYIDRNHSPHLSRLRAGILQSFFAFTLWTIKRGLHGFIKFHLTLFVFKVKIGQTVLRDELNESTKITQTR